MVMNGAAAIVFPVLIRVAFRMMPMNIVIILFLFN